MLIGNLVFSSCEAKAKSLLPPQNQFLQRTNLDLTVPDFVAMVLQGDMAFAILSKSWKVFEFGLGNQMLQLVTAQLVIQYLPPVEPVFDVAVVNNETNLIPSSYRFKSFVHWSN